MQNNNTNNILLKEIDPTWALTISSKLEHKISYLCLQLPSTEWSGILYYSVDSDQNILIGQDVQLLNIGTTVATEFDISPEVISYMTENDLLDCQTGLIHSHHTMATFFSSTDMNTLKQQGKDRNKFLSLIVNNMKQYSAALTTKVEGTVEKTIKGVYKEFNDIERPFENKSVETGSLVLYEKLPISFQNQTFYTEMEDILAKIKKPTLYTSPTTIKDTFDWGGWKYDRDTPKTPPITIWSGNSITTTKLNPNNKKPDVKTKNELLLNKSIDAQIENYLNQYDVILKEGALHLTAEILTLSKLPLVELNKTITEYHTDFEEIISLGFKEPQEATDFIAAFIDALMVIYEEDCVDITIGIFNIITKYSPSKYLDCIITNLKYFSSQYN